MASFYFDNDVTVAIAAELRARGYGPISTHDLGLGRAMDALQLLTAVQRGSILVTHNAADCTVLHEGWKLWSPAWRVGIRHAGILIIPQQRWTAAIAAAALDTFVASGQPLVNELYRWWPKGGWARHPRP